MNVMSTTTTGRSNRPNGRPKVTAVAKAKRRSRAAVKRARRHGRPS